MTITLNKIILTERYDHIVFRLASAEQRVSELSNTMMNHFAYNKPVTPLRCDKPSANATVSFQCDSTKQEVLSTPVPNPFEFKTLQPDGLFKLK